MRKNQQRNQQKGFILNTELMLFTVILVLGLLIGWVSMRDSVNAELIDSANAIEGSIKFYYFNDPDRGLGPAFVEDELLFFQAGAEEGQGLDNAGAATATGSVVPEGPAATVSPVQ